MSATTQEIIAFLLDLPHFPFARLEGDGDRLILIYEGRPLAEVEISSSHRALPAAAIEALNAVIHRGIYSDNLATRPPGEAVNSVHQLVELWDALSFAIARAAQQSAD